MMEDGRTSLQSILVSTRDECFEVDAQSLHQETLHHIVIDDLITMWEKKQIQWLDLKAYNQDTLKIIVDDFDTQKRCELTLMTEAEKGIDNVWYYCTYAEAASYILYFAMHATIQKGVELLETAHLY